MQCQRLGRGVNARRGKGALDPRGADIHRLMAERRPDLAGEACHAGLAVGAGHRDHRVGLRPEPQRRGMGQRGARVLDDHESGLRGGQLLRCDLDALPVGQDRARPHAERILNELTAMDPATRKRGE